MTHHTQYLHMQINHVTPLLTENEVRHTAQARVVKTFKNTENRTLDFNLIVCISYIIHLSIRIVVSFSRPLKNLKCCSGELRPLLRKRSPR